MSKVKQVPTVSYTPRKPVIFTPAKGKKHTYQFWF